MKIIDFHFLIAGKGRVELASPSFPLSPAAVATQLTLKFKLDLKVWLKIYKVETWVKVMAGLKRHEML